MSTHHDLLIARMVEVSERRQEAMSTVQTTEDMDRLWLACDDEQMDIADEMHPDRRYLRMIEIRAVEHAAKAAGKPIYNGCTGVWLRERYGDVVAHHMGVGWYLRPAGQLTLFDVAA